MNNLGFLTDFKLLGGDSEITESTHFFLVKTSSNPTFIDGNCLVLKSPELLKNKTELESAFKTNFGTETNQHHLSFKLTEAVSDAILQVYLDDQYEYEKLAVMTYESAKKIRTVRENEAWGIRAFSLDADWEQWAANEIAERPQIFTEASFKAYLLGRRSVYRALVQQGFGNFYGVFQQGELVASAGLYIFDGIGRFQQVRTLEKARRQGMCKALIQFIYRENEAQMQEAVMVADEEYHALKLYEGLGFKSKENQYSLTKVLTH